MNTEAFMFEIHSTTEAQRTQRLCDLRGDQSPHDKRGRQTRNHGSRRPNFVANAVPMPKTEARAQMIGPAIGIRRSAPRTSAAMTAVFCSIAVASATVFGA